MITTEPFSIAEGRGIDFWSRRWGVTAAELREAILQTGSLSPLRLKKYLKGNRRIINLRSLISYLRLSI